MRAKFDHSLNYIIVEPDNALESSALEKWYRDNGGNEDQIGIAGWQQSSDKKCGFKFSIGKKPERQKGGLRPIV